MTWREGELRKALGKYGASDERQREFARMGDELIISTPGNGYWLRLAKELAEQHRRATSSRKHKRPRPPRKLR